MMNQHKESFQVVGGHLALNLVNTVAPRRPDGGDHTEFLTGPADLLAWSRRVRLLEAAEADTVELAWTQSPGAAQRAMHATTQVREATYAVLASALDPALPAPVIALETLALRWAASAGRSDLVPGAAAVGAATAGPATVGVARLVIGTVPASMIQDRLAASVLAFVQTVDVARLRACPLGDGGCGWLFLDTSRNGSRRWCAMDDCGARAKARRLTVRRRESSP